MIGPRANKGQGIFPWLQQTFVVLGRLRDEPKRLSAKEATIKAPRAHRMFGMNYVGNNTAGDLDLILLSSIQFRGMVASDLK